MFESGFDVWRVICVAEVEAVFWTGKKCGPECSAELTGCRSGDVDLAWEASVFEEFGEVVVVDFVGWDVSVGTLSQKSIKWF